MANGAIENIDAAASALNHAHKAIVEASRIARGKRSGSIVPSISEAIERMRIAMKWIEQAHGDAIHGNLMPSHHLG